MVKINCILSLSHFCLERLRFSYNFPNFRSVFLWDFYHFQHVFWAFGQVNFPKLFPSGDTNRANLPLTSSRMLACLLFSQKKLHHRCSTGLYAGLQKYWNFQSEAKVGQVIAIVTTRSVACLSQTQSSIETDVIVVKKTCLFKFVEKYVRWKWKKERKVNMPECTYTNRILNIPQVLNMPKFWIWESSEYDRVLNMRGLHNVLTMRECALTELWIYLRF